MKRPFAFLTVATALALSLSPLMSHATHCTGGALIFSGVDTGQKDPNGNPFRPGPNGGLAGCAVDPADESLSVIYPGATNIVVAFTVSTGGVAPTGILTFNGVETPLTFTYFQPLYASSARWESQSVPAPKGTGIVEAVLFLDDEELDRISANKNV